MKGWCLSALKVLLYTVGAAFGGLCILVGIGLLAATPAAAAVVPSNSGPPGPILPAVTSTVTGAANTVTGATSSAANTATDAATGTASTATSAVSPAALTAPASSTVSQVTPAASAASTVTNAVTSTTS